MAVRDLLVLDVEDEAVAVGLDRGTVHIGEKVGGGLELLKMELLKTELSAMVELPVRGGSSAVL